MKAVIADGDPALLHGFEQGALDFGRRAIDFVCQEQISEDRTAMGAKFAGALVENFRADDVRRQQIDGELHATEFQGDGPGYSVYQQSLRRTRHALKQKMAAGKQGNQ